jgi:hypothetical protein
VGWFNGEWYEDGSTTLDVKDWCPTCDPDGIPEPYTLKPCGLHTPSVEGSADSKAGTGFWMSGSVDADGLANAKWCRLLHRGTQH